MKQSLVLVLVGVVGIVGHGCSRSSGEQTPRAEPPPAAVYKAGHGVQLSAAARTFVGLTTAEVDEPPSGGMNNAASIPTEALLRTARGDFVYVANGDWYLRTPVTVGARHGATVEIAEGLYEGDIVVVQGVRALALSEMHALNGGVGCADGH